MRSAANSLLRLACTYSIVARDPQTGELGVAVQSHWFGVGRLVCWAESGVGAVATQAMVEVSYGPEGLACMRAGRSAPEVLQELLAVDAQRELRQVAMLDARGEAAVHTGARCIAEAGHELGQGWSVQANMMATREVWPAMARAYREAHGDLAERLLAALEAAEAAGGDIRGKQAAAMRIVKPTPSGKPWDDVLVDLRVEDSPAPLPELRRLVRLNRAYQHMNQGDALLGGDRVPEALGQYHTAAQIAPEIAELPFWHATTLADMGRLEEALPLFRDVFARDPRLVELLKRLPAAGLLHLDETALHRILGAAQ
jgi:uncharacterized Ntn-hydrolase superfamily protein